MTWSSCSGSVVRRHRSRSSRAAGQYPFSPRWDADCGLLGQRIPVDDLPSADGGLATATRPAQLEGE